MSITGTDHTVVLVADIEVGIRHWQRLGMRLSHTADLADAGIRQAFFALDDGTFIELVAPLGADSPLQNALADRGEGIRVLALKVDDLTAAIETLQAQGVKLVGVGSPQVFVHPKSANGVMIQLWPQDRKHRWRDNSKGSAL